MTELPNANKRTTQKTAGPKLQRLNKEKSAVLADCVADAEAKARRKICRRKDRY